MPKHQYKGETKNMKYEIGFHTPEKRTKPRNYSPTKKKDKVF